MKEPIFKIGQLVKLNLPHSPFFLIMNICSNEGREDMYYDISNYYYEICYICDNKIVSSIMAEECLAAIKINDEEE